jgi:hypothetical protein
MENLNVLARKQLAEREEWCALLSNQYGAWIAPAGLASFNAKNADPAVELRTPVRPAGNVHHGPYGAYLAACVLYSVVARRNPTGLPMRTIRAGDFPVDVVLDEPLALWLQAQAWGAVQEYHRENGIGLGFTLPLALPGTPVVDILAPPARGRTEAERLGKQLAARLSAVREVLKKCGPATEGTGDKPNRSIAFARQILTVLIGEFPDRPEAQEAQRLLEYLAAQSKI